MHGRLIELFVPNSGLRRSTRFRASLETLDSRQLLATGVTAVVDAVTGSVGSPLPVRGNDSLPPGGIGYTAPVAPVGTPVPLVTLTSSVSSTLPATGYTGTVDWGDGSPVDAALFGNFIPVYYEFQVPPANVLLVSGPDHTYATPGTYAITITVSGPDDSAPTVYHDTATISNIPTISGQFNRLGDTGFFNNDGVTANNTPNYFGTTQPGVTVTLSATSLTTNQTLAVGTGVADASGAWNITTTPFADGIYSISATATNTFGGTNSTSLTGSLFSTQYLIIDAVGPKIAAFQFTNAKEGTFQVTYSDPAGLLLPSLTNPTYYMVNRPPPTPRKGQTFPVLTLTTSNVPNGPFGPLLAYNSATVTGTLSTGKALSTQNGTYTFIIHSAGIIGLSGAALDGEYTGKFPTGNGQAGGDFQVNVNVRNGKASGPIAITPLKVTVHPVKARAVVKQHA